MKTKVKMKTKTKTKMKTDWESIVIVKNLRTFLKSGSSFVLEEGQSIFAMDAREPSMTFTRLIN